MSSEREPVAIAIHGIGKRYRLGGRVAGRTLRETLAEGFAAPWLRIRAARRVGPAPAPRRGSRETFWALRDVSLDVRRGEVIGIVGRNGAGKSTLLKILSRITEPTEGWAEIRGRVGSLLEVGTGFHPELTGRENIYLYGSVLGMRRAEIARRFDEIVAFAEVEAFLDTPVKRYSSGMHVRLAFAVAAHLDPEVLLVDEVLAVGDATFQARCLGKMGDVARSGRTVLFVSHNLAAVSRLCDRGVLLDAGRVVSEGSIGSVITQYLASIQESEAVCRFPADPEKKLQFREVRVMDESGDPKGHLDRSRPFTIGIDYEVRSADRGSHVAFMLDRADGVPVCHSADIDCAEGGIIERQPGRYTAEITIPGDLLAAGLYRVRFGIARYGAQPHDYRDGFVFYLHESLSASSVGHGGQSRPAVLAPPLEWRTERRDGADPC